MAHEQSERKQPCKDPVAQAPRHQEEGRGLRKHRSREVKKGLGPGLASPAVFWSLPSEHHEKVLATSLTHQRSLVQPDERMDGRMNE